MRNLNPLFAAAALTALCFVHSVSASPVSYNSRSAWETALGLPSGGGIGSSFELDAPQTLTGTVALNDFTVSYSGTGGTAQNLNRIACCENNPAINFSQQHFNGFLSNNPDTGPQQITLTFANPLRGFGAEFDQANNLGMGMRVNGQLIDFSTILGSAVGNNDNGFVGVVDNMIPFTFVTFEMTGGNPFQGEFFRMDNPAMLPVPEPHSLGMFLIVAFPCLLGRRRRR